jgi:tetratricopeptide (TPR) repeat protein
MTVRVPFHLMRREKTEQCTALLLLSTDVRELLSLSGRVGADPLPSLFPVAGGFLVILDEAPSVVPPKTIRLRRLSENCYLPVDADLVPALFPDEVVELTRQRGLVFLPGQECLAFDPDRPLSAVSLLKVPIPKREAWQPFPDGPEFADRLTAVTRIVPDITPDDILSAGATGIGEEAPPRPPAAGRMKTVAGKMTFGLGKGLAALGTVLGLGALGRLGAAMMGAAVAAVPRLTEAILGKQEAALRELLRKFREGKTDEALKNALPMSREMGPSTPDTSDELPTHDIRWSLSGLFGSGGTASVWLGGADIQRELMNEYRKAAQAALALGDFRRAAFIYAKLLGELHTAADILAKGGLHRDAAILYRDLLKEPRWAAREFEAAGEWDEALRLYRQIGEHEQAGDLLRRMGEEGEAIEEYHIAARKIVEDRRDYLTAGDLMLRKTGRPDLAGAYFALGWHERDKSTAHGSNAVPCATRLAEIYAFAEPLDPLWTHIDEVENWLAPAGDVAAASGFFNIIVKLADQPHLKGQRAALRDRSKMALAAKLRQHPQYEKRSGNVVSDLFGHSGHWPAAVVSDANFALRRALKRIEPIDPGNRPVRTVRLGNDLVTAVAFAPESEDVFIGLSNGEVIAFQPRTGRATPIAASGPVAIEAIAVDAKGRNVVMASESDSEKSIVRIRGFIRNEFGNVEFKSVCLYRLPIAGWYRLNPLIPASGSLLSTPSGIVEFSPTVLVAREPPIESDDEHSLKYLILPLSASARIVVSHRPVIASGASEPAYVPMPMERLIVEDREIRWGNAKIHTGWRVQHPVLAHAWIAWLQSARDCIEIAGISSDDVIAWSEVHKPQTSSDSKARTLMTRHPEGYWAVAIWKPGMLVGVTSTNRVCWLRAGTHGFQEWAPSTSIPIPTKAVACFPNHATGEAIVILADGELVRVPVPI